MNYLNMQVSTYKSIAFNRKLIVILGNKKSFKSGLHLEAIVLFENNVFRVLISNGYDYLYDKSGFNSLKQALNIAHGRMVAMSEEIKAS